MNQLQIKYIIKHQHKQQRRLAEQLIHRDALRDRKAIIA